MEQLLGNNIRVTGINLSDRRIGDKGAPRLAGAFGDKTQVCQLWLRGSTKESNISKKEKGGLKPVSISTYLGPLKASTEAKRPFSS